MKRFCKFIGWMVAFVMGVAATNFWLSWAGELVSTKNSFAVAGGLLMIGVGLGTWVWVLVTATKKGMNAFWKWDPENEKSGKSCGNSCDCDCSGK